MPARTVWDRCAEVLACSKAPLARVNYHLWAIHRVTVPGWGTPVWEDGQPAVMKENRTGPTPQVPLAISDKHGSGDQYVANPRRRCRL